MPSKTLFVLEPDEKFVKALHLYFRGSDWELETYGEPEAILEAVRRQAPTASLLSLDPDSADSAQTTRDLVAAAPHPVLVTTPKKHDSDVFDGGVQALGAVGYIKKPFIKKAILSLLEDTVASYTPSEAKPAEDEIEFAIDDEPKAAAPQETGDSSGGMDLGDIIDEVDSSFDTIFPGDQPEAEQQPEQAVAVEEPAAEESQETARHSSGVSYISESGEGLQKRIAELEEELRQRSEEAKSAVREKERLERNLGGKESQYLDKIRVLEKQVEDYEEDVKKRKQLVSQLSESIKSLNEEIEEKERRIRDEVTSFESQIANLHDQLRQKDESLEHKSHEAEDKAEEISRQGRRIEDLERELTQLGETLNTANEQNRTHEGRISELEGQLDDTRKQLDDTRGELESTRNDLESTRGTLQAAEERIAKAKESFQQGLDALGQ